MFQSPYIRKVHGTTESQKRNTKNISLSIKLDKSRLITPKQTTKINLERRGKMKEEFQ